MSTDRQKFLEASRHLFQRVTHRNGAITSTVPAPQSGPEWQREATLVTPRVGALVSMAADRLGLPSSERWFRWLQACPNNLSRDRLLLPRYSTNGEVAEPGRIIAPDQQAWALMSLVDYLQRHEDAFATFRPLLTLLADGLESVWDGQRFIPSTQNLWETTLSLAHTGYCSTPTLLLTSAALRQAAGLLPQPAWITAAASMQQQVLASRHDDGAIAATTQRLDDQPTDAGLLAAWWPAALSIDELAPTLSRIDRECGERNGYHPVQYGTLPTPVEGGVWPLVTAWRSRAAIQSGDRERAAQLLESNLSLARPTLPRYCPLTGPIRTPDCAWTNAMMVLALDALDPLTL